MRTALKVIIIILALLLLMSCSTSDWKGIHMDSPHLWIDKKESASDNLDAKWKYTIYAYSRDRWGKVHKNHWFIWSDYDFPLGMRDIGDVFNSNEIVYYEKR